MSDVAAIEQFVKKYNALKTEIAKVIVGQDEVVNQILISIFSGGHALLIGVPGLAKTLMDSCFDGLDGKGTGYQGVQGLLADGFQLQQVPEET